MSDHLPLSGASNRGGARKAAGISNKRASFSNKRAQRVLLDRIVWAFVLFAFVYNIPCGRLVSPFQPPNEIIWVRGREKLAMQKLGEGHGGSLCLVAQIGKSQVLIL